MVGSIGSSCVLARHGAEFCPKCHAELWRRSRGHPRAHEPTMVLAFALLFTGFGCKSSCSPFHPIAADARRAPQLGVRAHLRRVHRTSVYGIIRVATSSSAAWACRPCRPASCSSAASDVRLRDDGAQPARLQAPAGLPQHLADRATSDEPRPVHGARHSGRPVPRQNHTLFKGLLFHRRRRAVRHRHDLQRAPAPRAEDAADGGALPLKRLLHQRHTSPFNGFSKWLIYQATFEKSAETGT